MSGGLGGLNWLAGSGGLGGLSGREIAQPRVVLVPGRRSRLVTPARHSPGRYVVAVLLLMLVASVLGLLRGPGSDATPSAEPCPVRGSATAAAPGLALRIRADPPLNGTTLLHLCALPNSGIHQITRWAVRARTAEADYSVAVQPVGDLLALAAVSLPAGQRVALSVDLLADAGRAVTLSAVVPLP